MFLREEIQKIKLNNGTKTIFRYIKKDKIGLIEIGLKLCNEIRERTGLKDLLKEKSMDIVSHYS